MPRCPERPGHRRRSRRGRHTRPSTTVAPRSSSVSTWAAIPAAVTTAAMTVRLVASGLDHEAATRPQPGRRTRRDPPEHVETVESAVERDPVLVVARLARHGRHGVGRDVRRVDDDEVDPTAQVVGQRGVEVALVDPLGRQVAAGAGHRCRVRVRGMHLGRRPRARRARLPPPPCRSTGRRRRPAGARRGHGRRGARCAVAARRRPASTATRRPANAAQPTTCSSGSPAIRRAAQAISSAGRRRLVDEQSRLVLGEDAAGGTQGGDELGLVHTTCPRRTTAAGSRSTVRSARGSRG